MNLTSDQPDAGTLWNQLIAIYRQACDYDRAGDPDTASQIIEGRLRPILESYCQVSGLQTRALVQKLGRGFLQQWEKAKAHPGWQPSNSNLSESQDHIPLDNIPGMIDSVQFLQARSFR